MERAVGQTSAHRISDRPSSVPSNSMSEAENRVDFDSNFRPIFQIFRSSLPYVSPYSLAIPSERVGGKSRSLQRNDLAANQPLDLIKANGTYGRDEPNPVSSVSNLIVLRTWPAPFLRASV